MIVRLFPDPNEQGLAIAVFGAAGGLANSTGSVQLLYILLLKREVSLHSWRSFDRRCPHSIRKLALDFLGYSNRVSLDFGRLCRLYSRSS
jgi:hypothetical protein